MVITKYPGYLLYFEVYTRKYTYLYNLQLEPCECNTLYQCV